MNKMNKLLTEFLCIAGAVLLPVTAINAKDFGTMDLSITGEVDLAKTPDPTTPHMLEGTLSGANTTELLDNAFSSSNSTWMNPFSVVGLSGSSTSCTSGSNIFESIPATNKKGVMLTNTLKPNIKTYVIPKLKYVAVLGKNQEEGWSVTGLFFDKPNGVGAVSLNSSNTCISPGTRSIPSTWTKTIIIYPTIKYPVYFPRPVSSGMLSYTGKPLYITTEGLVKGAIGYWRINLTVNVNIKSTCQISNVSNNNININMGYTNEAITESSLTFNCTGDGQYPVYLSARVTEGNADSAEPTRLLLKNTSSSSGSKRPWVMGKTFIGDASPALTCKDTNTDGLIKFNGQETPLSINAVSGQLYRLGIKWAICSDDTVPAGNYRGKTVISIYTKM